MKLLLVLEGKHDKHAVPIMVRRLLEPTTLDITINDIKRDDIHIHHGHGRGYFKKAVRWMLEAEESGYEGIVLLVDEDGITERVGEILQAQEHLKTKISRALGVGIRAFDAWMLADEVALSKVLAMPVGTQASPEEQREPKATCRQLLHDSRKDMSQSDMYLAVATECDLQVVEKRCPRGFGVFATRVRGITAE